MSTSLPAPLPPRTSDKDQQEEVKPTTKGFCSRKRPQKARKRYIHNESAVNSGTNATEGLTHVELSALKEAQELRDRIRATGLNVSIEGKKGADATTKEEDAKDAIDGVADGLTSHFSAEKSGQVVDKRMRNFIEEGLRKKFGDRYMHEAQSKEKDINLEDVFEIPEHLKVNERSVYDPSEGMPAAGLEELEVPLKAKQDEHKTELTTKQPPKKSKTKDAWLHNSNAEINVSGNFSSNFAHHRNEWIETHLGPQLPKPKETGATVRTDATERDKDKQDDKNGFDRPGQKRFNQASDTLFAERFRKRWRR